MCIRDRVTSAYRKAASEYPEEIYYTPTVRVEQHEEGKALCFTARVQIRPEDVYKRQSLSTATLPPGRIRFMTRLL